ncbi:MAG: hypothetical protein JSW06_02015 [Thermoplasmatales archaeon]|nr:MAG: hypothetical protein JSW06_02015 [Thermoplasmatales archaeon]
MVKMNDEIRSSSYSQLIDRDKVLISTNIQVNTITEIKINKKNMTINFKDGKTKKYEII